MLAKSAACVVVAVLVAVTAYTDVDDHFSYEQVAKNATELRHHLYCFMGKEQCSDIAAHYKSHVLDTLRNQCAYCTKQHKHNAKMFIHGVKEKFPAEFVEFKKMYDPEDKLFKSFEPVVEKF